MKKTQSLSRRRFLLAAGAASAAGAAAVAARQGPAVPEATVSNRAAGGYRASEHINNYYRTAKV
jgi:hypothetical protein